MKNITSIKLINSLKTQTSKLATISTRKSLKSMISTLLKMFPVKISLMEKLK
jgi:hypothetical protein